jgi:hypothetical protein
MSFFNITLKSGKCFSIFADLVTKEHAGWAFYNIQADHAGWRQTGFVADSDLAAFQLVPR